jgi:hypothetical protein
MDTCAGVSHTVTTRPKSSSVVIKEIPDPGAETVSRSSSLLWRVGSVLSLSLADSMSHSLVRSDDMRGATWRWVTLLSAGCGRRAHVQE